MRPGDEVAFSWDQLAKNSSTRLKKTPKTTQVTKFESDLFKTNDNTALESRGILQMFMWRGASSSPTSVKFRDFVEQ